MKKVIVYFIVLLKITAYDSLAADPVSSTVGTAVTQSAAGAVQSTAVKKVTGEGMSKSFGDFFNSPQGILLVSGIGAVYTGMLYNAAAKQEEEAEANIKKIDRVLAEFKDSFAAFCPSGRDDLKTPECYCYLAKGGKNPDRTKSQICQALWAKNDYILSAVAGKYAGLSKFVDPVGCLTVSGQFDEACKCKKFIDSKGNNACQKGVSINLPAGFGAAFAANTGIKEIAQLNANAGNGNPMLNAFSNGSLAAKAVATQKLKNQLLSKIASHLPENAVKFSQVNGQNVDNFAKAAFGEQAINSAIANSKSSIDLSGASIAEGKLPESIKAAAAKAGLDFSGSGKGLANRKNENKEVMAFNLGGEAGAQNSAGQLQDFPEQQKNYKIKGDISTRSDTSIFEIISNRYIQSGLKRLFDE